MSARTHLIGEDPGWRDPIVGLPDELINYYATAFHVGGYFMVSTFENYLRGHIALRNLMTGARYGQAN